MLMCVLYMCLYMFIYKSKASDTSKRTKQQANQKRAKRSRAPRARASATQQNDAMRSRQPSTVRPHDVVYHARSENRRAAHTSHHHNKARSTQYTESADQVKWVDACATYAMQTRTERKRKSAANRTQAPENAQETDESKEALKTSS